MFRAGQKVILIHSGHEATVVRLDAYDIVIVRLDSDGSEIPVPMQGLQAAEAAIAPNSTFSATDSYVPHISEPVEVERLLIAIVEEGAPGRYDLIFVNATAHRLFVEIEVRRRQVLVGRFTDKVDEFRAVKIGNILLADLAEKISLTYRLQRITTQGTEDMASGTLRLKERVLLKSKEMIPLLDFPAIALDLSPGSHSPQGPSLHEITREVLKKRPRKKPETRPVTGLYDPLEKAEFPHDIDLHIEMLAQNHDELTSGQIIQIQLRAAAQYIDKALRVGMEKVFLIHGKGKGRLKNEIHRMLRDHPHVKEYKNEYHPKYEFGATEVIFL